jgi:DNA polymerase-4
MTAVRKIIHIDMDAFFAAVEQRDFPEYRNKPLIVGGDPFSRGVVATCSYEARPFGIRSAMPASKAYRLCPQAIFVRPRFEAYRAVSQQIRRIFHDYTHLVEPLSLDEAYLDVSDSFQHEGSATFIAKEIKARIQQETQLTASAGVSYNKFLAKIASDINKPDGLCLIKPEDGENFIANLPIEKFHGVGQATANKMLRLGISNGSDLKRVSLRQLEQHFGKSGRYFYNIARGIDNRQVISFRKSKSVGAETTFQEDITDPVIMVNYLETLLQKAQRRLIEKKLHAHSLTIKIKYHDFVQITRSHSFSTVISEHGDYRQVMTRLLDTTDIKTKSVRSLGVTLSSLTDKINSNIACSEQIDIFG